ncbi:MAG: FecR domain-containing protein [Oligoflexia bacterium]|nr:FecR domain-containing protein [Oligoflexia bacterium]
MKRVLIYNFIVILVSLGGASACGYYLYADIYLNRSTSEGLEIAGVLTEIQQSVKRKFGDNMLWDLVNANEKLYWNDSIQTSEKSQAHIRLDDGSKISLGESSLVVLERNNNKLSLSLKSGQLVVDSQASADSQIKINGMDLAAAGKGTMSLQVDAEKGQLTATTMGVDGTGKQITIDKDGTMSEKEIPTILESPAPLSREYIDAAQTAITFTWQAKNNSPRILELAKDKNFKQMVIQKKLTTKKYLTNLKAGSFYWRVKTEGEKEINVSETRSFEIIQMNTPVLTTPDKNQSMAFRNDMPVVEFSWKGDTNSTKYLFETSDKEDFSNIRFKEETNNLYVRTSKISEGKNFWRVSAIYNEHVKVSNPSFVQVNKLKEALPPELMSPDNNFKLTFDIFQKANGIQFRWKSQVTETVEKFKFVLSRNEKLKDELVSFETTQNETLLKENYPEGIYYWSVGLKNLDGEWKHHEIRKLELGPLVPLLSPPVILGWSDTTELDLLKNPLIKWRWKKVEGAASYKFKLLKMGSKEEVVLEDTLNGVEKEKTDLPDGKYKWVVSSIDRYGRESEPTAHQFTVYHGKTLEAPDFDMSEVQ